MQQDSAGLGQAPLADIAQRSIARIVDSGIVVFVWMLITAVYYTDGRKVSTALLAVGFLAFYETVPIAQAGATIGKRIMSIRVVMAADGTNPPLVNAFLRVAPAIAVSLLAQQFTIFLLPLLYSIAGFVEDRRGLVDRLAGTAVIKVEP